MGQPAAAGICRAARPLAGLLAALTLALGVGACGDDPEGTGAAPGERVRWTLVLDYEPNAVHAGLLRAERAGLFDDAGIDLEIVAPSSTADALTQVTRGRAQVGLGDLIDVARRNERAVEQVAAQADVREQQQVAVVGAIVQEPLSGILVDADGPIRTAGDLAGRRIAVSGVPSDEAVVRAIGGAGAAERTVTLGFNGLKALAGGRVDATTAYWPADEVTLRRLGTTPRRFTLAEEADLHYPGLVAFVSRRVQMTQPERVRAFAEALARGTAQVVADPALGLAAVQDAYPELDRAITREQLERYVTLMGDAERAGRVDPRALRRFAAFAAAGGLTQRQLGVAELTGAPAGDGGR